MVRVRVKVRIKVHCRRHKDYCYTADNRLRFGLGLASVDRECCYSCHGNPQPHLLPHLNIQMGTHTTGATFLFCYGEFGALARHSECSVRLLYQSYCLDIALLFYPVSVVFSCRPPNMSMCWGTYAYVLRGKFVPRISVKCSGSLVNININLHSNKYFQLSCLFLFSNKKSYETRFYFTIL